MFYYGVNLNVSFFDFYPRMNKPIIIHANIIDISSFQKWAQPHFYLN